MIRDRFATLMHWNILDALAIITPDVADEVQALGADEVFMRRWAEE